jgi:hypothetical protein
MAGFRFDSTLIQPRSDMTAYVNYAPAAGVFPYRAYSLLYRPIQGARRAPRHALALRQPRADVGRLARAQPGHGNRWKVGRVVDGEPDGQLVVDHPVGNGRRSGRQARVLEDRARGLGGMDHGQGTVQERSTRRRIAKEVSDPKPRTVANGGSFARSSLRSIQEANRVRRQARIGCRSCVFSPAPGADSATETSLGVL